MDTKPVYKGGLTYQYNIADWTVFMDTTVEPEKADCDAGDDCKIGLGIPDSPGEELAGVFKALEEAKVIINYSCKWAVTIEGTSIKKSESDNPKFTFRTFKSGLVGG